MPREREREKRLDQPLLSPTPLILHGHGQVRGITITTHLPNPPISRIAVKQCTQRLLGGESRHHNAPARARV